MAGRIKLDRDIGKATDTYVQKIRQIINRDATIYAVIPEEIKRLLEDVKIEVIKLWEDRDRRRKAVKSSGLSTSNKDIMVNKKFYDDVRKWKITDKTAKVIANRIAKLLLTRFESSKNKNAVLMDYQNLEDGGHYFVFMGDKEKDIYANIAGAWGTIRKNIEKEAFKSSTKNLIDNTFNQLVATIKYSDIGHERSAAEVASDKLYHAIEISEPQLAPKFIHYRNRVTSVGVQYTLNYGFNNLLVDLAKGSVGGVYVTSLKLESRLGNLKELNALKNATKAFTKELEKDLTRDLIVARHSKSILRTLFDDVVSLFLGKKTQPLKKGKSTKTVKKTVRAHLSSRAFVNRIILKPNLSRLKVATKELHDKLFDRDPNLNKRIPELNTKLHDKIRENMGKGGSKQKLNYRTGRFARSARIEEFLPSREKNAINARVRYMKDPYSIFEPGGKLHRGLTGRDPHLIFGKSIRQLLIEQKIATFRRVKVELRG